LKVKLGPASPSAGIKFQVVMKKKGTLKRMIKGFFVRLEVYDTK